MISMDWENMAFVLYEARKNKNRLSESSLSSMPRLETLLSFHISGVETKLTEDDVDNVIYLEEELLEKGVIAYANTIS